MDEHQTVSLQRNIFPSPFVDQVNRQNVACRPLLAKTRDLCDDDKRMTRHSGTQNPQIGSYENELSAAVFGGGCYLNLYQGSHETQGLTSVLPKMSSGYFPMNRSGKRKSSTNEDSSLSPSRKQHITEEKMAACMQMLSLEAGRNNVMIGSVKQKNDDSDFEDDSDLEEEEKQLERVPIIELHEDFKQRFRKPEPILPESILDNLCKSPPCLALVPYVPPQLFVKNIVREVHVGSQQEERVACSSSEDITEPMKIEEENEFFEVGWDTDSDNDLVLD